MSAVPIRRPQTKYKTTEQLKTNRVHPYKIFTQKSHRKSNKFLVACTTIVVLGLFGLIMTPILINTQLAVLSYKTHEYRVEIGKLTEENQRLEMEINAKSSPDKIREKATQHGLVKAGETGFIDVKSGEIVGGTPGIAPAPPEDTKVSDSNSANSVSTEIKPVEVSENSN